MDNMGRDEWMVGCMEVDGSLINGCMEAHMKGRGNGQIGRWPMDTVWT
jgi:hypothetical protein